MDATKNESCSLLLFKHGGAGDLMSEPEESADETETWAVYRQDDHGNRFVVKSGLGRAQAEQLAREFESRGHKQMYLVERQRREPWVNKGDKGK
jgi:hypothetical protein